MRSFIIRRLSIGLFTLFTSASLIFFIIHLIPGDPVMAMLQDNYDPNAYAVMQRNLGLDRPLGVQYAAFLADVTQGNLGTSFSNKQPVFKNISIALPSTLNLAGGGILVAILVGIPAGIIAAAYRNRWPDYMCMVGALLGVSTPSFGLGVLLMLAFSLKLGWFPAVGLGSGSTSAVLLSLVLPAVTVGARAAGVLARITRSAMLEVLGQDYMRTAIAKGLPQRKTILKHGLRNAAIPVLTVIGLELGNLLGGTVVVELVFARHGLGNLLVESVRNRDFPQIQGALLLFMTVVLMINLVIDLAYGAVDPRIRYS